MNVQNVNGNISIRKRKAWQAATCSAVWIRHECTSLTQSFESNRVKSGLKFTLDKLRGRNFDVTLTVRRGIGSDSVMESGRMGHLSWTDLPNSAIYVQ